MRRLLLPLACLLASCTSLAPPAESYDTIIRGGTIVDGSGAQPFTGDVALRGDRIVSVAPASAVSTSSLIAVGWSPAGS